MLELISAVGCTSDS